MAEGFAHKAGWNAYSAGTKPEAEVNLFAVKVMEELDIDISHHIPQSVNQYLSNDFHLVATVCHNAREACPVFSGNSKHQIHHGFEDPANTIGNNREIIEMYRQIRNEIQVWVTTIRENYLNII